MDSRMLASYIDHTILKPTATPTEISKLCAEGNEYRFASVCVNGCYVKQAVTESEIPVAAVVGFPLGAMSSVAKAAETRQAVQDGAAEIDMVINIGWAKAGMWQQVQDDIRAVVEAAQGVLVKVIIETALLTGEEKRQACQAAVAAQAHFVKTSTGFSTAGANEEDVKLMRSVVGDKLGVKASGGIRNLDTALAMIAAGANRLGVSAGVQIIEELKAR